ncbi:hypothetical protein BDN70DRAFT_819737, partial [Pholiota conissans]
LNDGFTTHITRQLYPFKHLTLIFSAFTKLPSCASLDTIKKDKESIATHQPRFTNTAPSR